MTPLIDSHCHLDLLAERTGIAVEAAVNSARACGIDHLLCVAISQSNIAGVLDIASRFDKVFASVGIHPNSEEETEIEPQALVELARHDKVVAIGETGLDYYRSDCHPAQQQRFRNHIQAAKQSRLPLIIHTREARDDTLRILHEEGADEVGGVMHCFTENWAMAKAALELGFYISLSGIVTFRSATQLQEIARRIPADRLLVETDSPYLAPMPHRGKTNRPEWVRHVADFVADLRSEPRDVVAAYTRANFFNCFPRARHPADT